MRHYSKQNDSNRSCKRGLKNSQKLPQLPLKLPNNWDNECWILTLREDSFLGFIRAGINFFNFSKLWNIGDASRSLWTCEKMAPWFCYTSIFWTYHCFHYWFEYLGHVVGTLESGNFFILFGLDGWKITLLRWVWD